AAKRLTNSKAVHEGTVLAYSNRLCTQHPVNHQIANEEAHLTNTTPIVRPFLAHSACVSSIVSLAGDEATRLCLNGNRCDQLPNSQDLPGTEDRDDIPRWVPLSGLREQACISNQCSSLWELVDFADKVFPGQAANNCLLLTDRQLELLMPSPAEVF